MDANEVVALVQEISAGIVLALVIWAFITKRIVPGWIYEQKAADYDKLHDLYLSHVDPQFAEAFRKATPPHT